jgi:GNAT superfamily N-acetyltransferase
MTPRAMTDADRRYVVPTWALSSRYDGLSKPARFRLVDRIIDSGAPVIVLATQATVHAWGCGAEDTLHYVYVPPELRGHGIARRVITALLGAYPERINVTHEWPRESARFVFKPHLIYREAA